jgi:hypothetical protein
MKFIEILSKPVSQICGAPVFVMAQKYFNVKYNLIIDIWNGIKYN